MRPAQAHSGVHARACRQTDRQTDSQPASQPARQTDRQTDRQTNRQTQTHTDTYTHTHRDTYVSMYERMHACMHAVCALYTNIFQQGLPKLLLHSNMAHVVDYKPCAAHPAEAFPQSGWECPCVHAKIGASKRKDERGHTCHRNCCQLSVNLLHRESKLAGAARRKC